MLKWIFNALKALFGDFIARALTGAGLALVSYGALATLLTTTLNSAASSFSGIGGDMLSVLNLGGLGQILSILGSAMLTRVGIASATVGIKRAASGS